MSRLILLFFNKGPRMLNCFNKLFLFLNILFWVQINIADTTLKVQ